MQTDQAHVATGMPPLDHAGRTVSFFEFWPLWLMYIPVGLQWLALACRYRSLTLPLIANPKLPVSGMVGVGKKQVMEQAVGACAESILPWVHHCIDEKRVEQQAAELAGRARAQGIEYPFVCKPDLGCRGSGVKLVHDFWQLERYLMAYPRGSNIILQKLASWEPEAGVFYVRSPDEKTGRIVSLALKYSPYVVGDGRSTLGELIAADRRAGDLQHLYTERHHAQLDNVLADGETFRLVFSITHSRGGIFRNGNELITPELTQSIDTLIADIPELYYCRLDIKFSGIDRLQQGRDIEIVEINTASAESLHIWDRNARLGAALSTLLWQYRTLFRFGNINRKRGYRTPALSEVRRLWREEKRMAPFYPLTD